MDNILLGILGALILLVGIRLFLAKRRAIRETALQSGPTDQPQNEAVDAQSSSSDENRADNGHQVLSETAKQAQATMQRMSDILSDPPEDPFPVPAPKIPVDVPMNGDLHRDPGPKGRPQPEPFFAPPPVADDPDQQIVRGILDFSAPLSDRLFSIQEAGKNHLEKAVPSLIEALYDPDPEISAAASAALGRIGDPRAIEPLMEVVRKNDERLLSEVPAEPVGDGHEAEPGHGTAQDGTHEPELNPFKYKELTLFRVDLLPKEYFQNDGTPLPRRELVARGLKDNDQQLRKMAAKAAIGLGDQELLPALVETLQNPYEVESVRYLAAEALGGIDDDRTVDPLVQALKDENVAVRYSAAAALSKTADSKAVRALIEALNDPNEFVRSSVAYALGHIANQPSLEALLDALSDQNEVVRFSVAKALGTIGGDQVMQGLHDRLEKAEGHMRSAIIDALGHLKDERATDLLRKALRDTDSEVSFRASLALMNSDSLDALDELVEASRRLDRELMDWVSGDGQGILRSVPFPGSESDFPEKTPAPKPKPTVVRSAQPFPEPEKRRDSKPPSPSDSSTKAKEEEISTFKEIGGRDLGHQEQALEKLHTALQHPSPNVRGCAANALGDFTHPQARDLLLEALMDTHEYVRATAVSSLSKIGDPSVQKSLLSLVGDDAEEVRYALSKGLARFPSEAADLALGKLAENDPSRDVRRAARLSLESHRRPTPS